MDGIEIKQKSNINTTVKPYVSLQTLVIYGDAT